MLAVLDEKARPEVEHATADEIFLALASWCATRGEIHKLREVLRG